MAALRAEFEGEEEELKTFIKEAGLREEMLQRNRQRMGKVRGED